jgi:hypothetical protein
MQPTWKTFACGTIGVGVALAIPTAFAGDAMPVAQQNALVQKYCAVCHTDAARSGGLSLEHFDAAQAAPSLAAMMVSKLTSGVLLETVRAAASDPGAAALVARKMKSGAMGAAGIPKPDKTTIDALIDALASEAAGANEWHALRTEDPATKAPVLTASILRELPSAGSAGEASMYRLVFACNTATHEGEMQLAWAPVPNAGTLSAAVDGMKPLVFDPEDGRASINPFASTVPLPAKTLRITNPSLNESVEFPFGTLPQAARESLAACFKEGNPGQ